MAFYTQSSHSLENKEMNILHRDYDLPAVIEYLMNGDIYKMIWYKEGVMHRDNDKPAEICLFKNESTIVMWYKDGKLHRDNDKPANISYYSNRKPVGEAWFQNGKQHREGDKPADIRYTINGMITTQTWYHYGNVHRAGDKPADMWYFNDTNKIHSLSWRKENKPFRTKGNPHYIEYNINGGIKIKRYLKDEINIDLVYNTDGSLRDSISIRAL